MVEPPPVLLVRYRPGVVGLTRRVVHVVPLPAGAPASHRLTAYCGAVIEPGQVELMDRPAGAPCTLCLLQAPLPPASDETALDDRPETTRLALSRATRNPDEVGF
jgi:hypothetical protein